MANDKKDKYYLHKLKYEGKVYYIRSKTKEGLFEKVAKKKAELESGFEETYNPTLKQYYEVFTNNRRNELSECTLRSQKHQFEMIAAVELSKGVLFGDMKIKNIKRYDIEKARQILLNDGKTPQNLNICFSHLNHVFNNAVLDEIIVKNPCKALKKLKRVDEVIGDNRHRALTKEETERFFKTSEEKCSYYDNLFRFMIKTGMRIGEVTALYLTDIDRVNGFIHVRRTITRDEIGGYMVGDDTKTESGNRDIPLTPDILQIIRNQEELNRKVFGFDWSGLLFKSSEGSILREYTVNREIKRICKEAEIDYFTSHAFRNTFATRFIEQRPQDYKILSEILGHKDISITLNLYTHVMTENKVKAMNDIMIKII